MPTPTLPAAGLRARPSNGAALAGVVGCVGFVAAWAVTGAAVEGYSPVTQTISQLAAADAPHHLLMTVAIAGYGAGLVAFGVGALRPLGGPAWASVVVSGLATLGVAAAPLGTPTRDALHYACAGVGYATLAAAPLLAAGTWSRQGHRRRAAWSRAVGVASGVALVASLGGSATGLLQRTGLTLGDGWVVAVAAGILWCNGGRRGD